MASFSSNMHAWAIWQHACLGMYVRPGTHGIYFVHLYSFEAIHYKLLILPHNSDEDVFAIQIRGLDQ